MCYRKGMKEMYRRTISLMFVVYLMILAGFFCVRAVADTRMEFRPARLLCLSLEELERKAEDALTAEPELFCTLEMGMGLAEVAVSGQRVVRCSLLEQTGAYVLSDEELEVLQRIVEAEAGSEDEDGKLLVANVVLNRVNSSRFPDTVSEVVFQQDGGVTQFSPVASGRFYKVEISEETISAVGRALTGEDISEGALFFAARKYAGCSQMRWFDSNLDYLFSHGGHEFFK